MSEEATFTIVRTLTSVPFLPQQDPEAKTNKQWLILSPRRLLATERFSRTERVEQASILTRPMASTNAQS